ncbi:hypothetical protein CKO28_00565 [Rhodovibrio sodomensis]|uniref:KfrA N-terminal DNA-binding domain-containing protein n=1 Tax=Rhodovibrio sodomensis TaxID=1088 RepID=A0ABS1D9W5_9PROT|nr:hypothetical protein [Rhodovibrio sodomensis]MBK1666533.1 hypothetical protein [Rhodovibrio sodomensis]
MPARDRRAATVNPEPGEIAEDLEVILQKSAPGDTAWHLRGYIQMLRGEASRIPARDVAAFFEKQAHRPSLHRASGHPVRA